MPLDCFGGNHVFAVETPLPGMTCLCGAITEPSRMTEPSAAAREVARDIFRRHFPRFTPLTDGTDDASVGLNLLERSLTSAIATALAAAEARGREQAAQVADMHDETKASTALVTTDTGVLWRSSAAQTIAAAIRALTPGGAG